MRGVRSLVAILVVAPLSVSRLTRAVADDSSTAPPSNDSAPRSSSPAPSTPAALPQWGKGPFEVCDPFALGQLRMEPFARSPRTLAPAQVEIGLRGRWENDYGYADEDTTPAGALPAHRLTVDDESRDLDLVARVGVFPRVELGAELTIVHWIGGGLLDAMIAEYHRAFGIGDLERSKRPRNGYLVEGTEPGGNHVSLDGQLTGIGDGSVSARVLALEGGPYWPAVAFTVRAWVPISNRHFEHARGTAESLAVDLSKRVLDSPLVFMGGAAYTYYDESTVDGIHQLRHRFFFYMGFEWEITHDVSLVAHFWQETRRERSLYRHTNIPYGNYIQYVAGGIKVEPIPGLRIEAGILENVLDPNTTGDFGMMLNVWYAFDAGAIVRHETPPVVPPPSNSLR